MLNGRREIRRCIICVVGVGMNGRKKIQRCIIGVVGVGMSCVIAGQNADRIQWS